MTDTPQNQIVFSVVIPCYNVEKYVASAIDSVLNQTFPQDQIEIILVNDGSTDSTLNILEEYKHKYPELVLITQANRGLAGARNTGISHSTGQLVAFLDSDDEWEPTKLEEHYKKHLENPHLDVTYDASLFINEQGESLNQYQVPKFKELTDADILTRNPIGNGSSPVIKRTALELIKERMVVDYRTSPTYYREIYFDESLRQSEDIDCWIRMYFKGAKFEGINKVLTRYRVNDSGLSANWVKQYQSFLKVFDKVQYLRPDLYEQYFNAAKGYQLRYLARRAVRSRMKDIALPLVTEGLKTHPLMLKQEPKRTIQTLGAAIVLKVLPLGLFKTIESFLMKQEGKAQAARIQNS